MPSMNAPLQLTAAQAPTPNRPSTSSASSSEATKSSSNSKADAANETQESFASTLKSQMDKKPEGSGKGGEKQDSTESQATAATESSMAAATDATPTADAAAALLPFLMMSTAQNDAGKAKTSTESESNALIAPVETEGPTGVKDDASQGNLPSLLQTTTVVTDQQQGKDGASQEAADDGMRQANQPALAVTQAETTTTSTENLAVDPAMAAGKQRTRVHEESGAVQGDDFRAFMDRATALTQTNATQRADTNQAVLRVETPVGQTGWHEDMGQKLTWMVGNNRQQAELVLTPPQLGRVEVSLTMNGDQASAVFTSANPAVREVLEDSMQRLREVLATAGVTLGQTQVGAETPNQFANSEGQSSRSNSGRGGDDRIGGILGISSTGQSPSASSGHGMVDVFA